ncbi:MAG: cbb3-type cytochrome c oxidase subunit I [Kordiimonadaceae bacterium]|jgi:nitric oxide reductase subunit B|nr:cbb3-type cytochrome c oxidase subunit I [Kordiimonadaceae bacterium]MBT6032055.1 cbb3-type cytochrome c oxidase subunit I [Kordiimonadaceae bacterium]
MEQSNTNAINIDRRSGLNFIILGLMALGACVLMGVLGAFKYIYPDSLGGLEFHKLRPVHVSLAVAWIFLAAIGGIYHYLPNYKNLMITWPRAIKLHFWIFVITGIAILTAFSMGIFGGREYWAYPPALSAPIFATWILFGFNILFTLKKEKNPWPVYYWMWMTGIIFFLITFSEAHLYLIPFFSENIIRETTIQWKSYGALVGSWNMLVYGTGMFVMERISGNKELAHSTSAFLLYTLSFIALMVGWAHHVYAVDSATWIRMLAYTVSMAELAMLAKIIWDWRTSLTPEQKHAHLQSYRFIFAADIWVFLNLILAILISIPAFNLFSHGTHITVAHAMGTTIGINTMILMGSVFLITEEVAGLNFKGWAKSCANYGHWITNISLIVFLGSLMVAGSMEAFTEWEDFYEKSDAVLPLLTLFAFSGIGLLVGLWMVVVSAIRLLTLDTTNQAEPLKAAAE